MALKTQRSVEIDTIERAPFSAALGLKIESAGGGFARVRMPFDLRLLNDGGPQAPVHGGAIASLVDVAACAAVWSLPETQRSATVAVSINYTAAAVKTDLIAEARVRSKGKRIASLTVEVRDAPGMLIADAVVTYKIA